jgi:hypothetical protein
MATQRVNLFKNFNPYWGAVTGLACWFLLWHTPTFWKNRRISRDIVLAVHIVAAGTIYLACAHNCLITPSLHPIAKISHTWIGRLGLLSGVVSFSLGLFLAWSRLALMGSASSTGCDASVVGSTTLGFAIPITIGGILQIMCEVQGFRAIRKFKRLKQHLEEASRPSNSSNTTMDQEEKKSLEEQKEAALKTHIGYMLSLFVMACSIPAGIRLSGSIAGSEDGLLPTIMIIAIVFALHSIANRYMGKMIPSLPSSNNGGDEVKPIIRADDSPSYHSMSK